MLGMVALEVHLVNQLLKGGPGMTLYSLPHSKDLGEATVAAAQADVGVDISTWS